MEKVYLLIFLATVLISMPPSYGAPLKAAIFDIAPWGYRDSNKQIAGIEYEIIQAISKEMNEDIEINLMPYKRMMVELEVGKVDFSIFFRSTKSEKMASPAVKWGALDIIVVGMKDLKLKTYDDLKNKSIGVRFGGYFNPKFDNDKTLNNISHPNYAKAVSLVRIELNKLSSYSDKFSFDVSSISLSLILWFFDV